MKTQLIRVVTALAFCASLYQAAAQGTAFTYQGRLIDRGNPANGSYDLSFSLYTVSSGGAVAAGPLTNSAAGVTNGLFTVSLDFGSVFNGGSSYWLDISVRTNGNGSFIELSPRQPLTPAPYSIYSEWAATATQANGVAGGVVGPNAFQVGSGPTPGQVLSYNGSILAWTNNGGGGSGWSLAGNSSTIPGVNFLGTTDNEPLEFWVNNSRVFRLEPANNVVGGTGTSVDPSSSNGTISGGSQNTVGASASSASIGGGRLNTVNGNAGTVGGGLQNSVSNLFSTVSGGEYNSASANGAVVGGGYDNTASGSESTIAGGAQNVASGAGAFIGGGGYNGLTVSGNSAQGAAATVGGGFGNTASNQFSFVGGGALNSAVGDYASVGGGQANTARFHGTVPGGSQNIASGDYSFAAGTYAEALNRGSFVWADNQGTPFYSTADNQFNIRAQNGVRIVTGGAGMTIDGVPVGSGGGGLVTNAWLLNGNFGANPAAGYFLGTADTNGLELRVSSLRGMRLDHAFDSFGNEGINIVGGYWGNKIAGGVTGATIAGGGDVFHVLSQQVVESNSVTADFGSVGGGHANTAGNEATVPGGYDNSATGTGSFAAGRNAHANYDGSFVWGDGSAGAYDNAPNQFQVLATGGVGFYTGGGAKLSINSIGNVGFGARLGQMLDLYNNGTFDYGIGVQNATLYQRTGLLGGFAWYEGGSHNDAQNNPGGGSTLMTLDAGGNLSLPGVSGGGGSLSALAATFAGNMSACSVTIRGGCDLAEPFEMADKEVPQGAVVVIDEENPGHLRMSDRPYDTHVAGIISGANGIHPGIQMQQQGLLEGGQNVALSGRVYVLADASNGAIRPGDLLTTSNTPGHAMRVTNHAQAQGAILGKAMTGLKEGDGMVLVLVTLQ